MTAFAEKLISFRGKTQSITAWAHETGINRNRLSQRLLRGWSVERALRQSIRHAHAQFLTFKDKTQSLSAWAREFKIGRDTLKKRLQLGWDVETALTQTAAESLRIRRWSRHDGRIQRYEQTKPEIRLYAATYEETLAQLIRDDIANELGIERDCIVGKFTQDEGHWSESGEGFPWCSACGSFELQQFNDEATFQCENCRKSFEDIWACLNCTCIVCDDCLTTRKKTELGDTYRTIAVEQGLSRERIRQVERKALDKLRQKARLLESFVTPGLTDSELVQIQAAHRNNERATRLPMSMAQQEAYRVCDRISKLLDKSSFKSELTMYVTSSNDVSVTCHTAAAFERMAKTVARRLGNQWSLVSVYLTPPVGWVPPCERTRKADQAKAQKEKAAAEKKAVEEQRLKDWIERARAAQGADYREGQVVPMTITEYWHAYGVGENTVLRRMHPERDEWCPSHLLRLERPGLKLFMVVHSVMVLERYFQGGATKRIHLFRATEWRPNAWMGGASWHTAEWLTPDKSPSEWTMHVDTTATSLRSNRSHHGWQKWSVSAINP
jgi:hypothetical protein